MNKYQKIFNEYEVRDEVKERIMKKINNKKEFKLKYALILLGIVGVISLTSVYAEEISAFFKSWTKEKLDVPKEADLDITSKITNVDDVILNKQEDGFGGTVDIVSGMMNIKEIEDYLGIQLLKYDNAKANYRLNGGNNKEGYVSSIYIDYEPLYKDKDDREFATQYDLYTKQKIVYLSARLFTKNFHDDDMKNMWGVEIENHGQNNYQTVKLNNLGVTGIYYEYGPYELENDTKGLGNHKENHLIFVYDNISYYLWGRNMEMEEFINIAKNLSF